MKFIRSRPAALAFVCLLSAWFVPLYANAPESLSSLSVTLQPDNSSDVGRIDFSELTAAIYENGELLEPSAAYTVPVRSANYLEVHALDEVGILRLTFRLQHPEDLNCKDRLARLTAILP